MPVLGIREISSANSHETAEDVSESPVKSAFQSHKSEISPTRAVRNSVPGRSGLRILVGQLQNDVSICADVTV